MFYSVFFPIKSNTYSSLLQVCRCISELCRHKSSYSDTMLSECKARSDIPNPEVIFAGVYNEFSF
jgi:hypothetical protein